jgi:hypothetical protein
VQEVEVQPVVRLGLEGGNKDDSLVDVGSLNRKIDKKESSRSGVSEKSLNKAKNK